MNVKISYTVPFDRVPSKVDELLVEASRNLESVGGTLRPNSFDDEPTITMFKLELIDKTRRELASIDLLLEDCYSILAGYNKAMADSHMPKQRMEEPQHERVQQGGSSNSTSEGSNGSVRG